MATMDSLELTFHMEVIEGGTAIRATPQSPVSTAELKEAIARRTGIDQKSYYLLRNGKPIESDTTPLANTAPIIVVPRVLGGKGGFGSMLRAIGAQIEKTTNRDACRDLSGRRLRDINEEQRLKRWFAKQAERETEKAELRKQKLERMRKICDGPPLPKTEDQKYNQQRADMAESVFDAVDQGFEASIASSSKPSTSTSASSATATATSSSSSSDEDQADGPESSSSDSKNSEEQEGTEDPPPKPKEKEVKKKDERKIKKTMFDEDLDSDVSSSESEDEVPAKKAKQA